MFFLEKGRENGFLWLFTCGSKWRMGMNGINRFFLSDPVCLMHGLSVERNEKGQMVLVLDVVSRGALPGY